MELPRSELCGGWAEAGGCALDEDFVISSLDPRNGRMPSREFFRFMQTACLASCGWADKAGVYQFSALKNFLNHHGCILPFAVVVCVCLFVANYAFFEDFGRFKKN